MASRSGSTSPVMAALTPSRRTRCDAAVTVVRVGEQVAQDRVDLEVLAHRAVDLHLAVQHGGSHRELAGDEQVGLPAIEADLDLGGLVTVDDAGRVTVEQQCRAVTVVDPEADARSGVAQTAHAREVGGKPVGQVCSAAHDRLPDAYPPVPREPPRGSTPFPPPRKRAGSLQKSDGVSSQCV